MEVLVFREPEQERASFLLCQVEREKGAMRVGD